MAPNEVKNATYLIIGGFSTLLHVVPSPLSMCLREPNEPALIGKCTRCHIAKRGAIVGSQPVQQRIVVPLQSLLQARLFIYHLPSLSLLVLAADSKPFIVRPPLDNIGNEPIDTRASLDDLHGLT